MSDPRDEELKRKPHLKTAMMMAVDLMLSMSDRMDDNVIKTVDDRNPIALKKLFYHKLKIYLKSNEGNQDAIRKTFIEEQILRSEMYQNTYFFNKLLNEDKKYFNKLQRWIEFLRVVPHIAVKPIDTSKNHSNSEIAIAYCILEIPISLGNAKELLNKHSTNTDPKKLIQHRFKKKEDLLNIRENKAADTKHLKSLIGAQRLIMSLNEPKALKIIEEIIKQFISKLEAHY